MQTANPEEGALLTTSLRRLGMLRWNVSPKCKIQAPETARPKRHWVYARTPAYTPTQVGKYTWEHMRMQTIPHPAPLYGKYDCHARSAVVFDSWVLKGLRTSSVVQAKMKQSKEDDMGTPQAKATSGFTWMCALVYSLACICMQMFRLIWKRLLPKWRVSRRNRLGQKRILIVLWFLSLFHCWLKEEHFYAFLTRWEANSAVRFAPEDPQEMAWCRILDKGHEAEHKANEDYTIFGFVCADWHSNAGNTQKEVNVQVAGLKGALKSSKVSCLDEQWLSPSTIARFSLSNCHNGTFTQMASLHWELDGISASCIVKHETQEGSIYLSSQTIVKQMEPSNPLR